MEPPLGILHFDSEPGLLGGWAGGGLNSKRSLIQTETYEKEVKTETERFKAK